MRRFIPNEKYFVECCDCKYFVPQLNVFNKYQQGVCACEYKYKIDPISKNNKVIWTSGIGCGFSVPKTIKNFNEKEYFKLTR